MTRLKLPAYGKQLLLERRAGRHPLRVSLIYGNEWRRGNEPMIAVKPEDYAPGRYDWALVAGLEVLLIDQVFGADECEPWARPPVYGKFYDLARELAEAEAFVVVHFAGQPPRRPAYLAHMAQANRWFDRAAGVMRWPQWWSDALHARQELACDRSFADFNAARERFVTRKQAERGVPA